MKLLFYAFDFLLRGIKDPFKFIQFFQYLYLVFFQEGKGTVQMRNPDVQVVLDLHTTFDGFLFLRRETPHPELNWFYKKYLKKNSIVFDIGSSNGYFAMLAASIVSEGKVHAFEPVPDIYKNFIQSIHLNDLENIVANQMCVGKRDGTVKFYIASNTDTSSMRKTEHQKKITKTFISKITRLDTYCKTKRITKIDLIKIDVEGNELNILTSSKKILARHKPVLIVEFSTKTTKNYGYTPSMLYDVIQDMGYKLYLFHKNKLMPFARTDTCDVNVLCIP